MSDLGAYTEGDATDAALCTRIGETLHRYYPGHPWMVGISDIDMGMFIIDLPYKPPSLRQYAYLLHPGNATDDAEIKRAGGEWLERLGLARAAAQKWAEERALQNGLDLGNIVTKSKG